MQSDRGYWTMKRKNNGGYMGVSLQAVERNCLSVLLMKSRDGWGQQRNLADVSGHCGSFLLDSRACIGVNVFRLPGCCRVAESVMPRWTILGNSSTANCINKGWRGCNGLVGALLFSSLEGVVFTTSWISHSLLPDKSCATLSYRGEYWTEFWFLLYLSLHVFTYTGKYWFLTMLISYLFKTSSPIFYMLTVCAVGDSCSDSTPRWIECGEWNDKRDNRLWRSNCRWSDDMHYTSQALDRYAVYRGEFRCPLTSLFAYIIFYIIDHCGVSWRYLNILAVSFHGLNIDCALEVYSSLFSVYIVTLLQTNCERCGINVLQRHFLAGKSQRVKGKGTCDTGNAAAHNCTDESEGCWGGRSAQRYINLKRRIHVKVYNLMTIYFSPFRSRKTLPPTSEKPTSRPATAAASSSTRPPTVTTSSPKPPPPPLPPELTEPKESVMVTARFCPLKLSFGFVGYIYSMRELLSAKRNELQTRELFSAGILTPY